MHRTAEVYRGVLGHVFAMCVALDERDSTTLGHCDRVRGLAVELGRGCGLSERELRLLIIAAGFHDIGKIGIPDQVLKKPGKLTADEWQVMQSHAARSERILGAASLRDGAEVTAAVRHHHERIDGGGYPDGLAGEAIPAMSRIIAIADAYDAMARLRHYGRAKAHAAILEELRRHAGQQHDPYMVQKFASIIEGSAFKAPDRV